MGPLLNPQSVLGDVSLNVFGARGSGWLGQLHAAVVELYAAKGAEIKYSTVQNWYAGDENGKGGIYNFVTKRGLCDGDDSKISWTQVGRAERDACILQLAAKAVEIHSPSLSCGGKRAWAEEALVLYSTG